MLKGFEILQTGVLATARQTLADTIGASRLEPAGADDGFEVSVSLAQLGDSALCFTSFAEGAHLHCPRSDDVRQLICLDGLSRVTVSGQRAHVDTGNWSVVVPSGMDFDLDCSAGSRLLELRISRRRLERAATALWDTPRRAAGPASLVQAAPDTPPMLALRRAVDFAVAELEISGPDISAGALAELEDLLVTRFLLAHEASMSAPAVTEVVLPSRPQMAQLEDYVRRHWNEPLSIDQLAEVASVGARSIFRYFRQVHGSTPLDFMKSLRLREARRGLQNPRAATSVASEAQRCGFGNMGHFARDYRRKFGELPSVTLAAARARSRPPLNLAG